MGKKQNKLKSKKKIAKKLKMNHSLNLISPFSFNQNDSFIYNIKIYKNFIKFCNSLNEYKPTKKEISFLLNNIQNIKDAFSKIEEKKDNNLVINYFQKLYPFIIEIKETFSKETKIIEEILSKRNKNDNISILKIKEIMKAMYGINIGKNTIHRIMKNKLNYRYRKTTIKNKDLDNYKYIFMQFLFIKIIIRAMELNFNFIFIDESHFCLANNNFKTWIRPNDNVNYGPKNKDKINIILAVSSNKIINYILTKENINRDNFNDFMIGTIKKLSKDEIQNTIFLMDNLTVHLCQNVMKTLINNKLKVLYTVPYQSTFNPIELYFRFLKNYTYKKIFLNLKEMKTNIINILKSEKTHINLFKNYVETLEKYYIFIENNYNIDLEMIEKK